MVSIHKLALVILAGSLTISHGAGAVDIRPVPTELSLTDRNLVLDGAEEFFFSALKLRIIRSTELSDHRDEAYSEIEISDSKGVRYTEDLNYSKLDRVFGGIFPGSRFPRLILVRFGDGSNHGWLKEIVFINNGKIEIREQKIKQVFSDAALVRWKGHLALFGKGQNEFLVASLDSTKFKVIGAPDKELKDNWEKFWIESPFESDGRVIIPLLFEKGLGFFETQTEKLSYFAAKKGFSIKSVHVGAVRAGKLTLELNRGIEEKELKIQMSAGGWSVLGSKDPSVSPFKSRRNSALSLKRIQEIFGRCRNSVQRFYISEGHVKK